jgi:hypothetical protein
MSASDGPFLNSDGLIFYYDASNTQKSWKGRPVINRFAIPTPDSSSNVSFEVNGTGIFKRVTSGRYGTYDITPDDVVYRYDLGGLGCHYHGNDVTITAGQKATWSFDYYVDPSVTGYPSTNYLVNFEGVIGGAIGDPTPSLIGVWKRLSFTGTAGSTGLCRMLIYPGACGDRLATGGFVLFKNPQVEFDAPGDNPSPFVAGTRSSTQAIRDLIGNNTVTASSLTYNSNGTFSFNGSSNTLDCGNASALSALTGTSNVTVESWVNLSGYGSTSGYGVIAHKGYPWAFLMENPSNTMRIRFYLSGSGDISCPDSATHALNTWYHFVGTYDGSNMRFYRNGVLTNTVAGSGTIGGGGANMVVGSYSGAYFSQGQIPIVKVYNRTLSAGEINQNFNTLRSRYGI